MHVESHLSLTELKRVERGERDARRARRLRIVILAIKGFTAPAVAMSVGLSRRVCQSWVQRYNQFGLEGLEDQRGREPGGPLTAEQQQQIGTRLEDGPQPEDHVCSLRGRDVKRILDEEFGVIRSLSAVYKLLHRLGFSCLRPRPRHRKADPELQKKFCRELPGRLEQLSRAHPDKRLRVFFQDESRFGQQGTMTTVWARKGSRPIAVRQTEYDYLWVIGAVCPETGQAEGLLSPRLNTDVINVFLEQFAATLTEDEHAVMLWDGAGFHTSKRLQVPDNITLIQLPPYSPELNPIENLWHYLKSHYWSNRTYEDYDELEQAAIDAWHLAVLDADLMMSVCAAKYLNRADSK